MNNRELIQRAIDVSNLPGVEEWKPPTDTDNEAMSVISNGQVSFPALDRRIDFSTSPIEVEKKPDFEVKVWKAINGFMIEVCGKKYIAKNVKEMSQLFLKAFEEDK